MLESKAESAALSLRLMTDCKDLLDAHCGASNLTRFVCVSSVDGRLIAASGVPDRATGQRVAAVSSSVLALAETFTQLTSGEASYNVIAASSGPIVTVRIPSPSRRYTLSLAADRAETVAMALRHALDLSSAQAQLLP